MDFLPWKTFHRIVDRYGGDHDVQVLSCAEQFRVMAFAQLTYRESLRDIEVCLAAQAGKLYHMGMRQAVARSTLADANESRDWRIYFELAQRLIAQGTHALRRRASASNWPIPCMPWMPRPSICACRCSRGRRFAPPRRR